MVKKTALVALLATTILLGGCIGGKKEPAQAPQAQEQTQAQKQNQKTQQAQEQNQIQKRLQEQFGELAQFLRKDLTEDETKQLQQVIELKNQLQQRIKEAKRASEEEKQIKYEELLALKEEFCQQLLPYIDEEKIDEFSSQYCNQLSKQIKQELGIKAPEPKVIPPKHFSMEEVAKHNKPGEDCWTVINGVVYDLTPWFEQHPGGPDALAPLCGTDGTEAFLQKHGDNMKAMMALEKLRIGILAE